MAGGRSQKTLLLLGGARFQVVAIEAARQLGYRTVLCDYLPDNPGQYAADVFYQKSTTDYDAVLEVAKRERVDGVLSFASDVAAPIAARVATELGFPGNPPEVVRILSEKHLFRKFLGEHGLPVPRSVAVSADASPEDVLPQLEALHAPVMVKPTDSSGSKGISTLTEMTVESLRTALSAASEYSRNRILIVEERISNDTPLIVGGDIFVVDGRVCFWGLMRAIRDYRLSGLVPVGEMFPACLNPNAERNTREVLQKLVSALGFRFGEMNVEVIVDEDDTPYVIELAARAGGNFIPTQLQDVSGMNLVNANVLCAMGDDPGNLDFASGGKNIFTYVHHALREGTLGGISYSDDLASHLYRDIRYFETGDAIPRFVNAANAIGIAFFAFESQEQMRDAASTVNERAVVHVN